MYIHPFVVGLGIGMIIGLAIGLGLAINKYLQ